MKDFSKDDLLELKDIFDRVPHYCFDDAKYVLADDDSRKKLIIA